MEQKHKMGIGYGFRGWLLILFQAIAFVLYQASTNYPLNILNGLFDGFAGGVEGSGQQLLSTIYMVAAIIAIIIQLILANKIGKAKSIKAICLVLGAVSLVLLLLMMLINPLKSTVLWLVIYGLINITSVVYATFAVGILIGQWFPTRKGTVMGIATFAFPIANMLVGPFANTAFGGIGGGIGGTLGGAMATADGATQGILGPILGMLEGQNIPGAIQGLLQAPDSVKPITDAAIGAVGGAVFKAFLPFFIVFVVGWLIGLIFISDYPEQVGAFRDNDKEMSPEVAKAMMEAEIENKKTTVWKLGHTLACRDFWFITIPLGCLLMFSVGTMTQSEPIIRQVGLNFDTTMMLVGIFGLIGSYVLGILDTRLGTRKSVIIALCVMVIAGILGFVSSPDNPGLLRAAMICLAIFMGASSNYTVSAAAQYWRREDFSSVFAVVNPIANILASSGPFVVAKLMYAGSLGYRAIFLVTGIVAVVCIILGALFKPSHVKEVDDKYRAAAGKPLDDALVGRK